MCKCLEINEKAATKVLKNKYTTSDLIDLEFPHGVGMMWPGRFRATFTDVVYTLRKKGSTGKGQRKKTFLPHKYCPFCGKPYDNTSTAKPVKK